MEDAEFGLAARRPVGGGKGKGVCGWSSHRNLGNGLELVYIGIDITSFICFRLKVMVLI